jgi:hypothetical protein
MHRVINAILVLGISPRSLEEELEAILKQSK